MKKRQETIEDILKRYSKLDPDTGCLIWIGPKADGYGRMRIPAKGKRSAHVLAWEYIYGPRPEGFIIRRTCGEKLCVNIQHMVLFKSSGNKSRDDIERQLDRLKKRITVNPITHCWEWPDSKRKYGKLRVGKCHVNAHCLMWECIYGETNGLHVLHKCDNPRCVNPEHLFLGTHADNVLDKVNKNRAGVKLNIKAVKDIRASKLFPKELAKKYKVTVSSIYAIFKRRSWRHVE